MPNMASRTGYFLNLGETQFAFVLKRKKDRVQGFWHTLEQIKPQAGSEKSRHLRSHNLTDHVQETAVFGAI